MNSDLPKLKILLISPHLAEFYTFKCPNLGLAYIGASLLEEGHKVKILDLNLTSDKKRVIKKILKSTKYDVYGIGAMVVHYDYTVSLSKIIKKYHPNSLIVAGGSVASSIPEILLSSSKVDIAVLGEGELTIKEITKKINENDTDYSTIDGIYFKKNGQIIKTKDREPIENLDLIPIPAMHLYNMRAYIKDVYPICTTRGCPFHCTFCYHCYKGYKVRRHSTERIIKEIKLIMQKYKNVGIWIVDDNFTLNKKLVLEFCDALEKENLKVKWIAYARVDAMDEELVKRMKECGCVGLFFGLESGSQTILNNIKKQTTVEQARNAILLCVKYGIPPMSNLMIGNKGENYHTAMETYKFIKELNIGKFYNFQIMPFWFYFPMPFPKTELYEYAKKNGLIKNEVKLIKSFKSGGYERLIINYSELSDKKLLILKRSIERLVRGKLFFKNYFLDMTLGKYFTIILTSKDLKTKIINILKFMFGRNLERELFNLKYRYV